MKPFKSLDEQIEILKIRKLNFKDENAAKNYLLHNNYYNIINCYSKYFLNPNEKYMSGTYFENIIDVHHFDKNIKSTFFRFITEVEKTFKSVFAFRYSEYFKDIRYSYLDINNYDSNKILKVSKNISQLSNIISIKSNQENNSIAHYVENHDDVPMWVLINNLTFGQTSKLYSYMPMKLKNKIAKDLSYFLKINTNDEKAILGAEQLESYLINLVEFRNIIAHNNKIIDYKFIKHNRYNIFLHDSSNIAKDSPRNDVFNSFISMKCFLTNQEFIQLNNSLRKRFEKLKRKTNSIAYEKITNDLGFTRQLTKLEQNENWQSLTQCYNNGTRWLNSSRK